MMQPREIGTVLFPGFFYLLQHGAEHPTPRRIFNRDYSFCPLACRLFRVPLFSSRSARSLCYIVHTRVTSEDTEWRRCDNHLLIYPKALCFRSSSLFSMTMLKVSSHSVGAERLFLSCKL